MKQAEMFFEAGANGGGEALYRRPDGTFFTSGSRGGMLDEEEDPIISWQHEYPDFQNYWDEFLRKNGNFWPFLYPFFIHSEAVAVIQKAIDGYFDENNDPREDRVDLEFHFNNWRHAMGRDHQ
jgi:hypothetical protein